MKIKSIVFAVASTLSMTALADNTSVDSAEIQKAIQLLEQKGYQIDNPSESKKASPPGVQLKQYQAGTIDAFISGDIGRSRYKSNFQDISSDTTTSRVTDSSYKIRGSFAYQDPSKLGVQFDAVYSQDDIKNAKFTTVDLAGHAFYRNDKFLLGMFGQYRKPRIHVGSSGDYSAENGVYRNFVADLLTPEQVFFGGEAQGYFGDLTLTGQLARQEFVNQQNFNSDDNSTDKIYKHGIVATAKANYFINDNWKVTAGYTYNNTDLAENVSYDNHKFSVGTEYRLANYPVSFYGDYVHNRFKFDYSDSNYSDFTPKQDTDAIMVGLKFNFGSESLKSRDRTGASLDPISTSGAGQWLGNQLQSSSWYD